MTLAVKVGSVLLLVVAVYGVRRWWLAREDRLRRLTARKQYGGVN